MNQNQIIDNQNVDNDLQKAIDSITNSTNVDPVFSDPVAAPSSIPEGDTGELDESVGPFPKPKVEAILTAPEPMAPLEAMDVPEIKNFAMEQEQMQDQPQASNPIDPQSPTVPMHEINTESTQNQTASINDPEHSVKPFNTTEIKKAALRDLFPILDKININALQKFKIYRDIFEELKDYTVLEPAYQAARNISDETARAEALLYLVESIDDM